MADVFKAIVIEMMQNPPDPHESIPLANHKATMFGISIPFHVLTWLMVCFRLHTRFRVVREPGWDDYFVVLAAVFNLISMIAFLGGTNHGLGQHLIYILGILPSMMKWLYVTNAAYHTTAAFIKVSLLLQYLRLFRDGTRRKVCLVLLAVVILWGLTFSFMAWFPCFPVSGFWDRQRVPPATCYAFGYATVNGAKDTILSFAGTNMALDIAIFAVPLTEYMRKDLRRKQIIAMTGLFALGSIVLLMAALRLWSTFKHSKNHMEGFDFTWWYPEVLIISCLEVDFAIMSASMPIFWPTVVASWNHIVVTNEVRVTHHQRLDDESKDNFEMNRSNSIKSTVSTTMLTTSLSHDRDHQYYPDFDPNKGRTQVEVQPFNKERRLL